MRWHSGEPDRIWRNVESAKAKVSIFPDGSAFWRAGHDSDITIGVFRRLQNPACRKHCLIKVSGPEFKNLESRLHRDVTSGDKASRLVSKIAWNATHTFEVTNLADVDDYPRQF